MARSFALLLSAMLLATPAAAQEPVFPKTVTIVIAFEPAGSYDVFARLVARHIGRHLPGQPQVIAQNMPGAGGLIGANYLAQVAPRDGSVIGEISQTAAIGQALETPGVRYDVRTLNWIGRMTSNVQLLHAWKTSKAKSIRDVLNTEMIVAGTGPTSSSVVFPRIMNDLIGTKFRVVPGFQGAATATLAMERGEVDAVVRPWTEIKVKNPDWVREKTIFPIVQFSLARHADLPDIPTVVDLGREEAQRQLLALFASGSDVSNALLAPPGVPASTLETLRRAFIETGSDPQLLAEARTANLELDWMSGADLQALIAGVFKVQPDVIARAKQYNNNP